MTLVQNPAFAQMESMSITGYQYPEINSVFNVNLNVQGTSRSSGGLFDVHLTIYERDNPIWVVAEGVKDVYSDTNKITIDLKKGDKPYKPNVAYVLEVQHAAMITTFEFIVVDKSSEVAIPTIGVKPSASPLEQLSRENEEL